MVMAALNPDYLWSFYCGGGSGHVYCVALGRIPRRTVKYACGILPSRGCSHARLRRRPTNLQ